jgi:sugar lactone lactonase YvrE
VAEAPAIEATCVLPARARLGECPVWSAAEDRLYWIDIDGHAVHRFDPSTGADETREMPGRPGSLALTSHAGRLLVAVERRLGFLDWDGDGWQEWVRLEAEDSGNRLNDGRCDANGRFWVGTMRDPDLGRGSTGSLYRVAGDGAPSTVRREVGIPNGLAFSPDNRTMYFADTPRMTVWAFDFDLDEGVATNERVFIDFGSGMPGKPDGAAIDEDGGYWISCVHGSAVVRVTPTGKVDRRVELPVTKPTMAAFGGPDRSTLFVTTIGGGGSHQVDPSQPLAGGLFAADVGIRGLPEPVFREAA